MTAITSLDQVAPYPLCWPADKPRTPADRRGPSQFQVTYVKALRDVEAEMKRWRVSGFEISSNVHPRSEKVTDGDPGVALWFYMPQLDITRARTLRVLACDRYRYARDNVRAIGLTLEALRAVDRHGAYSLEQAVEGAKALPPPKVVRPWWEVLHVSKDAPLTVIEATFRALAKEAHPDAGGSKDQFQELSEAVAAAREDRAR